MCSPSLLLYCKTVIYNQPTRSISELLHMTLGNLLNFLCLDSLFVKKKKKIGIIIMTPASFAFKSLLLEMIFTSVTVGNKSAELLTLLSEVNPTEGLIG